MMTPTGEELYNSVSFWQKRITEQFAYLRAMNYSESVVRREVRVSAYAVLIYSVKNYKSLLHAFEILSYTKIGNYKP